MQTSPVQVTEAQRGSSDVDDAAQIWAEATAARDGDHEVADLSVSRPIIEAVLGLSPEAFVLIARADDGNAVGFAAVQPVPAQHTAAEPAGDTDAEPVTVTEAAAGRRAELAYFGVRLSSWGSRVGERLLRDLRVRLQAVGYRRAQLLVYTDNVRAIALYQRLGWQPRGEPGPHPLTGKPEQRYELEL